MSTDIDMTVIRRRVAQAFIRDGLFEIFLGWGLIMVSGFIATDRSSRVSILAVSAVTFGVSLPIFRKLLALRRIGYVTLGNPSVALGKVTALLFVGAIIVLLLAPLGYALASQGTAVGIEVWKDRYFPVGMGLTLAIVFGSLARRWDVVRFYVFAVVSALAGIAALLIGPPPSVLSSAMPNITPIEIQLLSTAAVVVVSGVIALIRFLRTHPVLREEAPDGQE
jgi:hypothetical protein